jgi:succinate dehydrogenase / fumarate reductase flavoprotein subunit
MFEQCLKNGVHFFNDPGLELLTNQGAFNGVLAGTWFGGEFHIFHAKAVLSPPAAIPECTKTNSNAHINTGRRHGPDLARRSAAGRLEFEQFHPTAFTASANLITEGEARGEGVFW